MTETEETIRNAILHAVGSKQLVWSVFPVFYCPFADAQAIESARAELEMAQLPGEARQGYDLMSDNWIAHVALPRQSQDADGMTPLIVEVCDPYELWFPQTAIACYVSPYSWCALCGIAPKFIIEV
jgi:hypothetical protein